MEREIHAFCDASQRAYTVVTYINNYAIKYHSDVPSDGKDECSLNQAMIIPRSKLNGALIAARLCNYVKQALKYRIQREVCWKDSSATLHWIRGPSGQYKQYVANRVNEINSLTEPQCWRYCPSDDNPADLSSRGLNAA